MTKFTEIFYRGPSDQKLSTIANCCPHLETMFLGSNNPRWLIKYWIVEEVTKHCYPFMIIHPDRQYGSKRLICNQEPQLCCISSLAAPRLPHAWEYHGKYRCTTCCIALMYFLKTTITCICFQVENIVHCLEEVGGQLKGLKIQCNGFDLSDIAVLCPHLRWAAHHRTCKINIYVDKFPLRSLIIQKESPNSVINPLRSSKSRLFGQLEHVEVSCPQVCFSFSK